MKYFATIAQASSIDTYVSQFSQVEVVAYNEEGIASITIWDKVNAGVNSPKGNIIMNNKSYRYIKFDVAKNGKILNFNGYIQAGYGHEEFDKNSPYATPLYKEEHFGIDDLNLKIFNFVKKEVAV